jgi:hypothetical protein
MVLIEFQQPKGTAWFDDAELVEESAPCRNLLAYPGFENDQILGERIQKIGSDYAVKAGKVVESMAAIKVSASGITRTLEQIDDMERIITGADMSAYFGYQVRDCRDAKARLKKCAEIMR